MWTGNMFVESETILHCACGEKFSYLSEDHAICPKCRTLWDKSAAPRFTKTLKCFMAKINDKDILTVGKYENITEFVFQMMRSDIFNTITNLTIMEIDETVYNEECARIRKENFATVMERLLG